MPSATPSMSYLPLWQEISGWYYLLGEDLGRTKHLKVARRRLRPLRGMCTHLQLLPRCAPPMASPLLPSWVAAPVPVFCGSCHPSYDQTMGPGTLHEYLLECRCQAASCSCTFIYLVRLFFERAIGLTPRGSAPPLAHGGMASGASYMPLPRVSGLRIPWLPC